MTTGGRQRWLKPALGLAVAAAFLYLGFRRLDWTAIGHALRGAAVGPLLLGLMLLAAGYTARIARWWVMLRAGTPDLPLGACARPFLASYALNNTVPLRAGDVVRAFGFRDTLRTPPLRVLGTLVVERVLDLLMLLALFFACLLGVRAGVVPRTLVVAGGIAGAAALVGLALLVAAPGLVRRLLDRALRMGPVARRAAGWAEQFVAAFAVLQSPGRALRLLLLSAVAWGCEGGMYASVAASLGIATAPLGPWFALATGTLATLLPSSPGYVGTFDYFAMLGLQAYGAPAAPAAAFALLVHLVLWAPVTLVGAALLFAPGSRAARAARASAAATAEVA